jgi:indole-3-glycerol phosphate synthase
VSVLAEPEFFGGGPGVFSAVRSRITLPMLYKDFVVSEKQVKLAKALGADAVLLIADVLSTEALDTLTGAIAAKGMEPFVELHDEKDLRKLAACANARSVATVGVNSRDLRTLEIDLARQRTLAEQVPSDYLKVAESGMRSPDDLERLAGFDAVLIGSMFMQAEDLEHTVTDTVSVARRVRG